ncbi:hypothetical protein OESDEN_11056 [Oesophagostomum dentatum]|uniref:Uncharacterized protein n=1 Tax=Oesophagostomum dentatum TaxID=61180 RepID=A0A0B1SV41_OESDE|nr:hypothetical protein OESDEN_11056 [Oesophagostomum dentatum]
MLDVLRSKAGYLHSSQLQLRSVLRKIRKYEALLLHRNQRSSGKTLYPNG